MIGRNDDSQMIGRNDDELPLFHHGFTHRMYRPVNARLCKHSLRGFDFAVDMPLLLGPGLFQTYF